MNAGQLMLDLSAYPPKTEVMINANIPTTNIRVITRECNGKVVLMIEENK